MTETAAFLQPTGGDNMEQHSICRRCGGLGCDIRILDCGCTLHAVRENLMITCEHFLQIL